MALTGAVLFVALRIVFLQSARKAENAAKGVAGQALRSDDLWHPFFSQQTESIQPGGKDRNERSLIPLHAPKVNRRDDEHEQRREN
ncbi:hypothetical protein BDN67DRAFT_972949 [Paxillus ammoniavirescens]|nr:hypothetical protein BDN67DRAFT_972949 [Paxillus ammoniavirescens]